MNRNTTERERRNYRNVLTIDRKSTRKTEIIRRKKKLMFRRDRKTTIKIK